jgi:hypothetical protein
MQVHLIKIFFVSSLFAVQIGYAKCFSSRIDVVFSTTQLNKNSIFLLEFFGESRDIIPGLNTKYPVYLESKQHKIPLIVTETLKGEFAVTQVLFKADGVLEPGKNYELYIGNLPEHRSAPRSAVFNFSISPMADTIRPLFDQVPVEINRSIDYLGCGPARWIYFRLSYRDQSPTLVKTKVKDRITGKTTEWYVPVKNGIVKIGHGMCSGGFYFEGNQFSISFALMDISGNSSAYAPETYFTKPAAWALVG